MLAAAWAEPLSKVKTQVKPARALSSGSRDDMPGMKEFALIFKEQRIEKANHIPRNAHSMTFHVVVLVVGPKGCRRRVSSHSLKTPLSHNQPRMVIAS